MEEKMSEKDTQRSEGLTWRPKIDSQRIKLSVKREKEEANLNSDSNEIMSYQADFLEGEETLDILMNKIIDLDVVFEDVNNAENEIYTKISNNYGDILDREEEYKERNLPKVIASLITSYNLNKEEKRYLFIRITNTYLGHGLLQPLWNDKTITEIMWNKPNELFVEIGGKKVPAGEGHEIHPEIHYPSEKYYVEYIRKLFSQTGRSVDKSSCAQNGELYDGSRITVNWMPVTRFPTLNVRKPPQSTIRYTAEKYIETGAAIAEMMELLGEMTEGYRNIFILGATGTAKTTVSRILYEKHTTDDRVVCIEDTRELNPIHPHFISLCTVDREHKPVTFPDLNKQILRMNPDRIGVQEVRSGNEASAVLKATMAGHSGIISTGHMDEPDDVTDMMVLWLQEAGMNISEQHLREMIHKNLDILVFVQKLKDGRRKMVGIYEVLPYKPNKERFKLLYYYDYDKDQHIQCGKLSKRTIDRCLKKGHRVSKKFIAEEEKEGVA